MTETKRKILDNVIQKLQFAKYNDIAPILLQAKAVLQPPQNGRQRSDQELETEKRGGKRLIWESGLIDQLADALYRDYLKVDNTTCSLASEDLTHDPEFRQRILHKTADGLLQLLYNIHQWVDWGIDEVAINRANSAFQKVCSSCYQFYIEIPHLVVNGWHSSNMMSMMEDKPKSQDSFLWDLCTKMTKLNESSVFNLPTVRRCRIMDAAAATLRRAEEPKLANATVQFILAWLDAYPLLLGSLITRHGESMKDQLITWRGHGFDTYLDSLNTYISSGEVADRKAQRIHEAAVKIQAFYRGSIVRRRIGKMKAGFVELQHLFRIRKRKSAEQKPAAENLFENQYQNRLKHHRDERRYLEKKLHGVSCIHASLVDRYLESEADRAATVIQAIWRGYITRKKYQELLQNAKLDKAARVIQTQMRKWYKKRRIIKDRMRSWPGLTEARREELQMIIDRYQERHKTDHLLSKQAQKDLHEKAQGLLIDHYKRHYANLNAYQKRESTLARIQMNIQMLENAPKLTDTTHADLIAFSVRNRAIASRAVHAHKEEMRFQQLPKWRQLLERAEDDIQKCTRSHKNPSH